MHPTVPGTKHRLPHRWWVYLLLLAITGPQPSECWQTTNVPISSIPSHAWGRSPGYRRPEVMMLYSTATPSSKSSEISAGDDRSHDDDDDKSQMQSTGSMSSSSDPTSDDKTKTTVDTFPEHSKQTPVEDRLSMPWSEVQGWALRDNVPKYTIMIPLETPTKSGAAFNAKKSDDDVADTLVFALWRTMLNEVPELAGYPIEFLQYLHSRQILNKETKMIVTPGLLPYLEDYSFASAGGVSGKVYGVPGLADGTRIETSAVTKIEVTLPQGFVRTSDGKAAYELGRPQREDLLNSVNTGHNTLDSLAKNSLGAAKAGSYELLQTVKSAAPETVEGADGMLLRLGASTGILLAGATAINMLSHHMTVNVFWV